MHLDEYRAWLAAYDGGDLVLEGPLHIRTIYIGTLGEVIQVRSEDPLQIKGFIELYPMGQVHVQHVITTSPREVTVA